MTHDVDSHTLHRLQARADEEGITVEALLNRWLQASPAVASPPATDPTTTTILSDMRALQELYLELNAIDDLLTLYRTMIQSSRERLGLDRLALFLLDSATNTLHGTYGIDTVGSLRDERYYTESVHPDHWTHGVLQSPNHASLWLDAELYDDTAVVAQGWKAAASLWNGQRALGFLVTDNLVTHRPPRPYELELISILGTTFGHIIERKQGEIAFRQSEARLRSMMQAIPDMIFQVRGDGTFVDFHASDHSLLAVPPEQFLGKRIDDIMPPEVAGAHHRSAALALSSGVVVEHEYELIDGHGVRNRYEARTIPYADEGDVLTIIRNVTDLRAAQELLRERAVGAALEQERVRLLTQFIQDAAHEFRTPLSIIRTSLYILERLDDPIRRQDKLDQIDNQVQRLAWLVDKQLKMAKLESPSVGKSAVDITQVLQAALSLTAALNGRRFVLAIPSKLPRVLGIADDLTEMVVALLDNAFRYSSPEATVSLIASHDDAYVIITVRDQGSGIAGDKLPHIFDTFWRGDLAHSTPGLGLGLPIARKIVELHGGRIEVESVVGEGSTFSVFLPTIPGT